MKYPKTLYVKREADKNDPKSSFFETLGATPEDCAEVNQVIEVAVYEFKKMVKVKTIVALEPGEE